MSVLKANGHRRGACSRDGSSFVIQTDSIGTEPAKFLCLRTDAASLLTGSASPKTETVSPVLMSRKHAYFSFFLPAHGGFG